MLVRQPEVVQYECGPEDAAQELDIERVTYQGEHLLISPGGHYMFVPGLYLCAIAVNVSR